MSVKIIRSKETLEFNPSLPLEEQIRGCKQVVIDYAPNDTCVSAFIEQIERIAKNGVSCQMNIKFNSNNSLAAYRAERRVNLHQSELEMNEVIKKMVTFHHEATRSLAELSQMCERVVE